MRDAEYSYITTWEETADDGTVTFSLDVKILYTYYPATPGYFNPVTGVGAPPCEAELEHAKTLQGRGSRWIEAEPATDKWATNFVMNEDNWPALIENAIEQAAEARLG